MAELEHPEVAEIELPSVLFALSDPSRLEIVRQIADRHTEWTCQSVALDMPKSTRSHHLKVLRESGVVRNAPAVVSEYSLFAGKTSSRAGQGC